MDEFVRWAACVFCIYCKMDWKCIKFPKMFFIGKIHSWNDKIWPRFGNWPSVAMKRNEHIYTIMGMWYYIVSLYHNNSQFCVCYVSEWAMMMGIARQHCFVIVTPVNQMHIDHRDMHLQSPNSRQNSRSILPDASAQTQPKWVIVRKIHMQNVLNKALYKFKQQKQTIDIRNGMNRIPTQNESHTKWNESLTHRERKKERGRKSGREMACVEWKHVAKSGSNGMLFSRVCIKARGI